MIGKPRKYCAPRRIGYPLQLLDVVVDQYARGSYSQRNYGPVTTDAPAILLMTSGHLGDALILTYAFPLIRARYPNAQIDILAGSWCDPIWKGNPYIRRVIHLNHVSTNRKPLSKLAKWREFYQTTKSAIQALKDTVYDYSADVRFSDSPMHFILPFLKVRQKLGFGTRGFGGLLDHEFFMPEGEVHNFDLILTVLKPMGVTGDLRTVEPYFPHPAQAPAPLWARLGHPVPAQKPILICPESGNDVRMLPLDYWSKLAGRILAESPHPIIFSGQKAFTTELYNRVLAANPAAARSACSGNRQANPSGYCQFKRTGAGRLYTGLPAHAPLLPGLPYLFVSEKRHGHSIFPHCQPAHGSSAQSPAQSFTHAQPAPF